MAGSRGNPSTSSTNCAPPCADAIHVTSSSGPAAPGDRAKRLFGRRKGHPLRERQSDLFESLLPRLAIDLARPAPCALADLFPHAPATLVLEIGFGGGEHLAAGAQANPGWGFIGAEAYLNGMAKMLVEIDDRELRNVRLYCGDAHDLLDWLPAQGLDRVDLLYLDPWPKRRHWKRRFVSQQSLDALARVLKPGAQLRFASDWSDYVTWTLMQMRPRRDFRWLVCTADDWRQPWPGWPGTRYEAKALREGRTPTYLTFERV
ncbi:MAG: tRNA (guanosine(46)-N7)-methyltransferase TrmB [Rhodobiaceae bacterium]|nr:tRNA (guanosine(46)-N7)-methyltransferase TrmB [Rhodobiaceae bacterium]